MVFYPTYLCNEVQRESDAPCTISPSLENIRVSRSVGTTYIMNLQKVLCMLDKPVLKQKKKKQTSTIPFFGGQHRFIFSKKGIAPLSGKVTALQKFPCPKNITELKAYLRALNCYLSHLPNMVWKLFQWLLKMNISSNGIKRVLSRRRWKCVQLFLFVLTHPKNSYVSGWFTLWNWNNRRLQN